MNRSRIKMEGTSTFNTFSYLLNGAFSLLASAKQQPDGSNYCRVSAVVFAAFAFEAHLNHIGNARLPSWDIDERKLSWETKFDLITQHLEIELNKGHRPYQTIKRIFGFRDQLAHGKTTTHERNYEYQGNPSDDLDTLDPVWLRTYWSDDAVDEAVNDVFKIIEWLHEKAGFEKHTMHSICDADLNERI